MDIQWVCEFHLFHKEPPWTYVNNPVVWKYRTLVSCCPDPFSPTSPYTSLKNWLRDIFLRRLKHFFLWWSLHSFSYSFLLINNTDIVRRKLTFGLWELTSKSIVICLQLLITQYHKKSWLCGWHHEKRVRRRRKKSSTIKTVIYNYL